MTHDDHRPAWQAQSLLLGYPDDAFMGRLDLLTRVADRIAPEVARPMARFLDHVGRTPVSQLAAEYVATFDHRKKCCLYLTYYAHGDTRNRGMALLALKQTYQAAGMRLLDGELPDHLAVVLEYAAGHDDPAAGRTLLSKHRAGLELLRLALRDADSPWTAVLDSVSATLPPIGRDLRAAVARLAAEGPPDEQVGLDPFGAQPNPLRRQGVSR